MVDKTRVPNLPRENNSSTAPSFTATLPASSDGNQIRNKILLALPPKEKENLLPKLEFMRLNVRHVLHEPGDTLRSVYFPNSGLVSILSVFPDGKCVEVGLVGKGGIRRPSAGRWFPHRQYPCDRSNRGIGLSDRFRRFDWNA